MTRCWLVTDEAAGNQRQAEALARAMGLQADAWTLRLRAPWSWWAPRFERHAAGGLPPAFVRAARDAPPELAIGCGRAGALATAWLRATSGCYAVQILDPRANRGAWDLVVTPAHDARRGADTINSIGALNAITPARLAAAALEHATLARLPAPRTAVLVGGSTRRGAPRCAMAGLALRHPRCMAGARRRQLPGQRLAPHPGAAGGAIARGLRGLARHGVGSGRSGRQSLPRLPRPRAARGGEPGFGEPAVRSLRHRPAGVRARAARRARQARAVPSRTARDRPHPPRCARRSTPGHPNRCARPRRSAPRCCGASTNGAMPPRANLADRSIATAARPL